jgi:sugar/nucleoside kinase (ribokinase family)
VGRLGLVGNLSHDVVDGAAPRLGGGVFHGARALKLLGRPAQIIARGELIEPLPLPAEVLPARETTAFSFRYEGDTRVMEVEALGEAWAADEVAPLEAEWVHLAGLLRSDFPVDAIAALAQERMLSLDGQALVRVPVLGPLRLDPDFDPRVLEGISILKLSEEEADVLDGVDLGVPEVIVTRGSRGSIVLTEGQATEIPAPALSDVDPTGAGDAFAVGYLAARSEGHDPVEAALEATELVSRFLS